MKKNSLATQKRRNRLRKEGLCTKCGKTPAKINKTKCESCLQYFVEYNRKNKSKIEPKKKIYRENLRKLVIDKYGKNAIVVGKTK